jgi:glutamate-1-semialdehyde 2,1-aminomutase
VQNYQDSLAVDHQAFSVFFHHLLDNGIYLPPSAVDGACMSAAHSQSDIEESIKVMIDGFKIALGDSGHNK